MIASIATAMPAPDAAFADFEAALETDIAAAREATERTTAPIGAPSSSGLKGRRDSGPTIERIGVFTASYQVERRYRSGAKTERDGGPAVRRTLPMILLLAACSAPPPNETEPTVSHAAVPSASLPSSAPEGEVVHGWPDTSENQAGLYSWDGDHCASAFCTLGFMHNGYGSGDLEIRIDSLAEAANRDDGANPVIVAGHLGTYRRVDARQEEWVVDSEGTTVFIQLTTRPRTSEAELAEAHAIIDSMRVAAKDNRLGFTLVFRLMTNDWDSG